MNIKPIKTEEDYNAALERLEVIFDADPGTPEGDEVEILGMLIERYENEHYPIDLPDTTFSKSIFTSAMAIPEQISALFLGLHDGTVMSCEPIGNGYRFAIDCQHIAERLNPEFEVFYLDILNARLVSFAPWPLNENGDYENIAFQDCFQYEPEITNSQCEPEGEIKLVLVTSEFDNPPYSGAEIAFTASGMLLYDQNNQILEPDDFFSLVRSYWDGFSKE